VRMCVSSWTSSPLLIVAPLNLTIPRWINILTNLAGLILVPTRMNLTTTKIRLKVSLIWVLSSARSPGRL